MALSLFSALPPAGFSHDFSLWAYFDVGLSFSLFSHIFLVLLLVASSRGSESALAFALDSRPRPRPSPRLLVAAGSWKAGSWQAGSWMLGDLAMALLPLSLLLLQRASPLLPSPGARSPCDSRDRASALSAIILPVFTHRRAYYFLAFLEVPAAEPPTVPVFFLGLPSSHLLTVLANRRLQRDSK